MLPAQTKDSFLETILETILETVLETMHACIESAHLSIEPSQSLALFLHHLGCDNTSTTIS